MSGAGRRHNLSWKRKVEQNVRARVGIHMRGAERAKRAHTNRGT